MKRVWAALLSLVMVFSLTLPVGAAEKATASTMRLMETEGTACVENAAGKSLKLTKNMRLYNGYEVSTEAASYAYVSLDSSKAVKLDASSAAEVSKSGRQLELKLTEGKLFFNVPVALKSDESMEIRTSTMMMGVRGTSGWVSVLDRYTTRIGILEGMVTIYSQDPITGADRSVTITGGQTATIIRHERAQAMEQELIRQGVIIEENIVEELTELGQVVEELREDGVPGFAAAEVAKDSELQERINNESPLDADLIAQNAAQKLAEDEAAAAQKEAQQQPQDSEKNEPVQTLFAEPETVVVSETVYVEVPGETVYLPGETVYVPTSNVLDDPTVEEVVAALAENDVVAVTNASASNALDLKDIYIESGKTLYILSGELTNTGVNPLITGADMDEAEVEYAAVHGLLIIDEEAYFENNGFVWVAQMMGYSSRVRSDSDIGIRVLGNMGNHENGEIRMEEGKLECYGELYNHGTIEVHGGKIVVGQYSEMHNYGLVYLHADTELSVESEGYLTDHNFGIQQSAASSLRVNQGAIMERSPGYSRNRSIMVNAPYGGEVTGEFYVEGTYIDYLNEVMVYENGSVIYLGSFYGAIEYAGTLYDSDSDVTLVLLNRETLSCIGPLDINCNVVLDMNGNRADLLMCAPDDYDAQSTFYLDDSNNYSLTLRDSVNGAMMGNYDGLYSGYGGGELRGCITVGPNFELILESGTVSFRDQNDADNYLSSATIKNNGTFEMVGGIVKCTYYSDSGCAALDLSSLSSRHELRGGKLLARNPTTTCVYSMGAVDVPFGVMGDNGEAVTKRLKLEFCNLTGQLSSDNNYYLVDEEVIQGEESWYEIPCVDLSKNYGYDET